MGEFSGKSEKKGDLEQIKSAFDSLQGVCECGRCKVCEIQDELGFVIYHLEKKEN